VEPLCYRTRQRPPAHERELAGSGHRPAYERELAGSVECAPVRDAVSGA